MQKDPYNRAVNTLVLRFPYVSLASSHATSCLRPSATPPSSSYFHVLDRQLLIPINPSAHTLLTGLQDLLAVPCLGGARYIQQNVQILTTRFGDIPPTSNPNPMEIQNMPVSRPFPASAGLHPKGSPSLVLAERL